MTRFDEKFCSGQSAHTATAEARKLSKICEKFSKKFRQIDADNYNLRNEEITK